MIHDPHLRAADADRERTAELLREHCSAGRLTMEEFHTRLDACFDARTYGDLDALLADLPGPDPYADLPVPPRGGGTAPYPVPPSAEIAPWRGPVASFISTTIIVWTIWAVLGGGFPWPAIVTAVMGASLVRRAIAGRDDDDKRDGGAGGFP